jgi:hypothetical protein
MNNILELATHEQLKDMYRELYRAHEELRLKYDDLKYNQSWEASAKHTERTGGWL